MSDWTSSVVVADRAGAGDAALAAVVDEHRVRACAGMTMVLGAVAFAYAYFRQVYWPLQVVSALFALDFLIRVTAGLAYSPAGVLAGPARLGERRPRRDDMRTRRLRRPAA